MHWRQRQWCRRKGYGGVITEGQKNVRFSSGKKDIEAIKEIEKEIHPQAALDAVMDLLTIHASSFLTSIVLLPLSTWKTRCHVPLLAAGALPPLTNPLAGLKPLLQEKLSRMFFFSLLPYPAAAWAANLAGLPFQIGRARAQLLPRGVAVSRALLPTSGKTVLQAFLASTLRDLPYSMANVAFLTAISRLPPLRRRPTAAPGSTPLFLALTGAAAAVGAAVAAPLDVVRTRVMVGRPPSRGALWRLVQRRGVGALYGGSSWWAAECAVRPLLGFLLYEAIARGVVQPWLAWQDKQRRSRGA